MSESPIIQALQSVYEEAKTVALAELVQYGDEWNVVDIYQTSSTKYEPVAKGPLPPPDFIQREATARCTVICQNALWGKMNVELELTYDGKWRVKEIARYA